MSMISLLFYIFAAICLLFLAVFGYLQLYKRNINKALDPAKHKPKHMTPPYKVAIIAAILLIISVAALGLFFLSDSITDARAVEQDARNQAEKKGMNVAVAVSDHTAAVLYYSDDRNDHSFAFYENKGRMIANYVFSHGGSSTSIERSVHVFRCQGELALFSLNELHIAKIVCHDGEIHLIDPEHPFVLIIPSGGADIYDKEGNLVDLGANSWYEITEKD